MRRREKHIISDLAHSVSEGRSLYQIHCEHQVRDMDGCLGNKNGFSFHTLPGEGPGCGNRIAKNRKSLKTEDREKDKYEEMDLSLEAEDAIEADLKMSAAGNPGYMTASSRGEANRREAMCVRTGLPITLMGGFYRAWCLCITGYEFRPFMEVGSVFVGRVGPWVGRWACIKRPERK